VAVSRTPIPIFLQRVRALVYQHEAWRALFYGVAALAALTLVLPLLGIVLGGSRATALAVLGIGGLVVVLLILGAVVLGVGRAAPAVGRRSRARALGRRPAQRGGQ